MQTTRFARLSGMVLAVMLTLLVGRDLVFGHDDDDRREPRKLEGTWDVTLAFPCDDQCPCPGGTPNFPIPVLHMYMKHGSYLQASGGNLFNSPALGSWEGIGHHQFEVRYKFFLFNSEGIFSRSEKVINHIHLTGPDTFKATAIFHLFDADEKETSPNEGCLLYGDGRRVKFE